VKQQTEWLKYEYTREERAELSLELARANQMKAELELKKKQVASRIKAEIEDNAKEIQGLATKVHDGYEYRNIPVVYVMDSPRAGVKAMYREDNGEFVRECRMSDEDRQQVLDLENAAEPARKK